MMVLFDIDDTLIDHSAATRAAATALHATLGLAGPAHDFYASWCAALDRHFARYLKAEIGFEDQRRARVRDVVDVSLSDAEADAVFAQYLEVYEASWSLFPDVLPCLARLSTHRLGVISNGRSQQQRKKLARTGIGERFECLVFSDEAGWTKPAPEIFLHACRSAGERPDRVTYVGDQYEVDAEAARRAGLNGVWLDRRRVGTSMHTGPIIGTLEHLAAG
jgi:putative hydrolase of the HAD superfamily